MSLNASLHPPHHITMMGNLQFCWNSREGALSLISLTIINSLILLPLCISILYLGHQQWRQQRRGTPLSHSDIFTYNMVIIELINILGSTLCCCGVYAEVPEMQVVGIYLIPVTLVGQMMFHILTCLERYVAVVHPVTYLGLRKAKGVRIRNVTIGCAWLLSFTGISYMSRPDNNVNITVLFSVLPVALIFMSFCSISVLCALIRPQLGDGGWGQKQVGQPKMRAFYTIMAILGALLIRFGGSILVSALYNSQYMMKDIRCALWFNNCWFCLPSSLVLPLLYLHRAGKLPHCKSNSNNG